MDSGVPSLQVKITVLSVEAVQIVKLKRWVFLPMPGPAVGHNLADLSSLIFSLFLNKGDFWVRLWLFLGKPLFII